MSAFVECPYCHHHCGEASLRSRIVELEREIKALRQDKGRLLAEVERAQTAARDAAMGYTSGPRATTEAARSKP